jgi:hypothetical protein
MGKHTFKTALNFEQVEAGSAEDNVLVRTADGDVKEVSRSEFSSGKTQDLQSVLENGKSASYDSGKTHVYIADGTVDDRFFEFSTTNGLDYPLEIKSRIQVVSNSVSLDSQIGDVGGQFAIEEQGVRIMQSKNEVGTEVTFETPTENTRLLFPAKSISGDYTLATLDDIPSYSTSNLNEVLSAGNSGGDNTIILSNSFWTSNFSAGQLNINDTSGRYTQLDPQSLYFVDANSTLTNYNRTNISSCNQSDASIINTLELNDRTTAGIAHYSFNPNKSAGYYTLATLDDIKIGTTAPASTSDTGEAKEIRVADGYIYWYVEGTGWLRSAGATF